MLALNSRPPMLGVPTSTPVVRRDTLLGRALQNVVLPGVQVMDLGERVFASSGATSGTLKPGPTGPARNYTGTPAASQIVPVRGASAYPFVQVWVGRYNAVGSGPVGLAIGRAGGSGDVRQLAGGSSTFVQYQTRNNYSATSSAVVTVPGGSAIGVDLVMIGQCLSATDHRLYCNGVQVNDTTNSGTPAGTFGQIYLCRSVGNNDHDTYLAAFGAGVALPDAYALELSRSPARLFGELLQQPRRRVWAITPAAGGGSSLTPGVAALTLSGPAPTLAQTTNSSLTPAAGALTLATFAPTVAQTANASLAPGVLALTLAGPAPTVAQTTSSSLTPGALALTLAGPAPAVSQTSGLTMIPAAAALTLAGPAPTVAQSAHVSLTPAAAALTLAGPEPTVVRAGNVSVTPGAAALTLATAAPTVAQTTGNTLTPAAATLSLAGAAPTVDRTTNVALSPAPATLAITTYLASLSAGIIGPGVPVLVPMDDLVLAVAAEDTAVAIAAAA